MPPTTEEKLEEELSIHKERLENVRYKILAIQSKLSDLEDQLVGFKLAFEQKKEELRQFRLMYPNVCKQTRE
jgi:predicted  nucleic acid-binding Zn-ribbon protein